VRTSAEVPALSAIEPSASDASLRITRSGSASHSMSFGTASTIWPRAATRAASIRTDSSSSSSACSTKRRVSSGS
jgi:hypothetical protein